MRTDKANSSWIGGLGGGLGGFTWTHLDSLGFTWIQMDSLGLTWIHLDSLGFTWIHLDSLGLTWIHLDSLGLTWTHLDSLGFTWTHLNSLDLTRTHLNSLGLTRTLPKLLRLQGKREKGGGEPLFSQFPPHYQTARACVRPNRNDFPVGLTPPNLR